MGGEYTKLKMPEFDTSGLRYSERKTFLAIVAFGVSLYLITLLAYGGLVLIGVTPSLSFLFLCSTPFYIPPVFALKTLPDAQFDIGKYGNDRWPSGVVLDVVLGVVAGSIVELLIVGAGRLAALPEWAIAMVAFVPVLTGSTWAFVYRVEEYYEDEARPYHYGIVYN
jgi:hypothetical protein